MKRNTLQINNRVGFGPLPFRLIVALFLALAGVAMGTPSTQRQVSFVITDGTLQDHTFGPSFSGSSQTLLAPAAAYSYSITGSCYATGDVTLLIGSGTQSLASALDTLDSNYSQYLQGSIANPGGTLPCTLLDKIAAGGFSNFIFSGTASDENIVGVDATGRAYFSATNVTFQVPIGTPDSSQIIITSATVTATSVVSPTFTTGSASLTGNTTATLNGTVNPNGAYTSVWFEYGTTGAYGFTSGTTSLPVLLSGTAISQQITGLSPGMTYHYAVTGSNVLGTFVGTDGTFGVPALAGTTATIITGSAGSLTVGRATLFGSINANGLDTTGTFNYGTSGTFGLTMTASPSPVSGSTATVVTGSLTGLTAGQTYYYQLVGSNAAGSSTGATLSFTTPATSSAPAVVTGSASSIGTTTATLNAMVNPNAAQTNVTFSYGLTGTYGTTVNADTLRIGGTSAVPATAELTGLTPGLTYHFTVTGSNNNGVVTGSDAMFTTASTSSAPTVTTGSATGIGTTGVTVNGSVNPNGLDTMVTFNYGLTGTYGSSTASQDIGSGTSAIAVSGSLGSLTPNTVYHFQVSGSNSQGLVTSSDRTFMTAAVSVSGTAPTVTTGSATGIGTTGATVNGSVNPNGLDTMVTFKYGLTGTYGSVTASQDIGSGTSAVAVSGSLGSLTPNTLYHFAVTGSNSQGLVAGSDQTFTTAAVVSANPPTVVTGSASNINTTTAMLNGTVNPNGGDTTVIFEYGLTGTYGSITPSQDIGSGTNTAPVSTGVINLALSTQYHFRVTGSNSQGLVTGSDQVFTTLAAPPAPTVTTLAANPVASTTATLNGSVNPNGVSTTAYFEYGFGTSYGTTTVPVSIGQGSTAQSTNVSISGLSEGATYHFRAIGASTSGTSFGADTTFVTQVVPSDFTGNYQAAITGSDNASCGLASVMVTKKGTFSAALDLAGKTTSFTGNISTSGSGSATKSGLTLQVQLGDPVAVKTVTGTVSGSSTLSFVAAEAVTTATAAKYTVRLPHPVDASLPQGNGYGALSIAKTGKITVTGELGDGSKFTGGGVVLSNDTWALYAPLYAKQGCVVGTLTFESTLNGDLDGAVTWIKPMTSGVYTTGSFATSVNLYGSLYVKPAKGAPALTSTSGNVGFAAGGLPSAVNIPAVLNSSDKFTFPAPLDGLTMKLASATGVFSGSIKVVDPITSKTVTEKFNGAVFQGALQLGTGVFKGPAEAGSVDFFGQ